VDDPFAATRIITITVNSNGDINFDSDLPAAESLWVLEQVKHLLLWPKEPDGALT
jgi:hypothetical protein